MLEDLRQTVLKANLEIVKLGLVVHTWGNVSAKDHETGLIAIKPSGVSYDNLAVEDIPIVDPEGKVVDGKLNPSSDTPTHLELYRHFSEILSVVHTHSPHATSWAQAGKPLPCYGTTHADNFYGTVPITRPMEKYEIENDYELMTGRVIVETFLNVNYMQIPAVLVRSHGVFTWGKSAEEAVLNNLVLEESARMALYTQMINSETMQMDQNLIDKHYLRKHGKNSYYGQKQ